MTQHRILRRCRRAMCVHQVVEANRNLHEEGGVRDGTEGSGYEKNRRAVHGGHVRRRRFLVHQSGGGSQRRCSEPNRNGKNHAAGRAGLCKKIFFIVTAFRPATVHGTSALESAKVWGKAATGVAEDVGTHTCSLEEKQQDLVAEGTVWSQAKWLCTEPTREVETLITKGSGYEKKKKKPRAVHGGEGFE